MAPRNLQKEGKTADTYHKAALQRHFAAIDLGIHFYEEKDGGIMHKGTAFHGQASRPSRRRSRSAFTLVEIMIVVSIIAVLLNIAAPAFIGARDKAQAKSCIKNLSNFATAKEQYAMDSKTPQNSTALVTWANISPYIKLYAGTSPTLGPACPSRGDYYTNNFGDLKTSPTCPYGGPAGNLHLLP